jgi:hypothetical protein
MAVRGWLGRLFGGGGGAAAGDRADEAAAVTYRDYVIVPKPIRQGGQFLTAGTIAKEFPDGPKEHRFVRADTHSSEEDASRLMVQKAQRLIDEMGDRLFGS